jgi:hypothetical protein
VCRIGQRRAKEFLAWKHTKPPWYGKESLNYEFSILNALFSLVNIVEERTAICQGL